MVINKFDKEFHMDGLEALEGLVVMDGLSMILYSYLFFLLFCISFHWSFTSCNE
jgi:hypothetical protein